MKKISLWARQHPNKARLLIIICFFFITFFGIVAGSFLDQLEVVLPPALLYITISVLLVAYSIYPSKSVRAPALALTWNYRNRKFADGLLVAGTFLLVVCISNNQFRDINFVPGANAASVIPPPLIRDTSAVHYKSIAAFSTSLRHADGSSLKWKEKRKLLRQQVKAIKHSDELSRSNKTLLTILSVLAAFGLLYLVAALACNLSCNGSESAAILLGLGGSVIVIFLLVLALRSIKGRKKVKEWQIKPPPPDA